MVDTHFFFNKPVVVDAAQLQKMQEIARSGVAGFRHDPNVIHAMSIDDTKWKDAYTLSSPVIDSDAAMIAITELVELKGATFVKDKTIEGDLRKQEKYLLEQYSAHAR
jgi:D-amino-acid oxidase